jgi:2'-5' RNA ligase
MNKRRDATPDARAPMTVQCAIVAFPMLESADQIEAVRQRFDPLASVLNAHVTLVFPFTPSAEVAEVLYPHVAAAVADLAPFPIRLTRPTPADGNYLFLQVARGDRLLIQLHDRLYSGLLGPFLSPAHSYVPHVTVGRFASAGALSAAAPEARELLPVESGGVVDRLAILELTDGRRRATLFEVPFERESRDSSD